MESPPRGIGLMSNKTTFHTNLEVEKYYKNKKNYQDDIPFDLLNMVSLAKGGNRNFSVPKMGFVPKSEKILL